ncbi:OmpH family outer membrane protein [Dyella acidiphila]|uniref:OmpH family outer membrane protein n=1 Tax=Dyella acidiphila TaxID=2775866 RepID=A0ABR9GEF1_9GAMM|nr:OmpH family outer membrane protein [Dyella acidiphila]MBE1162413.1 OmpH family outer membrane protein [Dyella acidiphila]
MRIDRTLLAVAAVALIGVPGAAVHAQTSATGGPSLNGPVVPGVCLLSREAIFANAKVGQAATARLKQLAQQAQSQIDAERKPIDTDVQAYRAKASSLSADQRQAQEQALGQRMQQVQIDQQTKGRQIEATRVKALDQIAQYAQPVIASAYESKKCGLLLDRNVAFGGNMANDLTPAVVQGLDAKITTISFNLEPVPAANTGSGTP